MLESAARLQRSLRRARVQIGVDRSKAQGKDLGRPRNATGDEEAIIGQVGNGAVWFLCSDEKFEIITACQIAIEHERKVGCGSHAGQISGNLIEQAGEI